MEWLHALHPDYWFFRQTRNSFIRYWDGRGWTGFFASWFSGGAAVGVVLLLMLLAQPGFAFSWTALIPCAIVGMIIGFFLIPISAALILIPAFAREEIKNRRESQRRYLDAILKQGRNRD